MEIERDQTTQSKVGGELLSIRSYTDYRVFIRDWFENKKRQRAGFSYRRFSTMAGLKSPNFMQLVILGERNVSDELVERLARVMSLKGPEKSYFAALVAFGQAKNDEERGKAEKQLLVSKRKMVTTQIDRAREQVVAEWYHMLVRELAFLPDFELSGDYVSRALSGLITPEQGEESLKLLIEGGFLVVQADGKYGASDVAVDTGDYVFGQKILLKNHSETLAAWAKSLSKLSPNEQTLGVLHIPINSEKLPEFRERIRRFQDEIIGWLVDEKNPDRVVQLGTYLMPFARER